MPWIPTVTFTEEDFYNAVDLSRVYNNLQHIKDQVAVYGYTITYPYTMAAVTRTDFPTVARVNGARKNVIALRTQFYAPFNAPNVTDDATRKQTFDYNEANKLEQNLQGIYEVYESLVQSLIYSGTFYAGEDGLL